MKNTTILLVNLLIIFNGCKEDIISEKKTNEAGICLTFDDTYIDQWYELSEVLIEENVKATFFVTKFGTLKEPQIIKLQRLDSLGFEIGCHGYRHIDADNYLSTKTLEQYFASEISPALKLMNENFIFPKSFSYPYGSNNDSLDSYLLSYFEIIRDVTDEQRKPLEKSVDEIDEIFTKKGAARIVSALGIDKNFSIDEYELRCAFERAKNNDEILCMYAHCPVNNNAADYQIEIGYIKLLFDLVEEYELSTYNISELSDFY